MLIAGFDTETTGLDVVNDQIIQVAVVLWDTESKNKKAKVKYDALINSILIPKLDPKVIEIHGITNEDLEKYGRPPVEVLQRCNILFSAADAVIAHNGNLFDRPLFQNCSTRHKIDPVKKLWIDTSCDIEFPAHIQGRKLVHLAAEHGFVNPFPHDATSDVLTMLKIADQYDWKKIMEFAKAPTLTVRADATYQQKDLAKKQGYRWDGDSRSWIKSIKDFQLNDANKAALEAGFKVIVLKGAK